MTKILFLSLLTLLVLVFFGCDASVDNIQDFAMQINSKKYQVSLNPPAAKMVEVEGGFSYEYRYSILFPIKNFNRMQARGFEFVFKPKKITAGNIFETFAGDDHYDVSIEYHPTIGHRHTQRQVLIYSSREKDGYLKVRFDEIDPRIGGKVKGLILEAVLYGFYEDIDTIKRIELKKEKKLEIYNFKFNAVFRRHSF